MEGLGKMQKEVMKRLLENKKEEFTIRLEHYNAVQKEEKTGEANDRSCIRGLSHLADCINECSVLGNPEQMIREKVSCLKKINKALDAIKEGTFGICSSCSEYIEFNRLKSIPFANHCIECAKEIEKVAKRQNTSGRSYSPKTLHLREIIR